MACHDAHGLWQMSQPGGHRALLLIPVGLDTKWFVLTEHVAGEPELLDDFGELLAAAERPFEAIVAGEAKVLDAAFGQMFGRQPGDRSAVGNHARDVGSDVAGTDVNDRQASVLNDLGDVPVFDASDNTVALPLFGQPRRWGIASALLEEVSGPAVVLTNVGVDAAQEAAGVRVRSLDQEGYARPLLHGWDRKLLSVVICRYHCAHDGRDLPALCGGTTCGACITRGSACRGAARGSSRRSRSCDPQGRQSILFVL